MAVGLPVQAQTSQGLDGQRIREVRVEFIPAEAAATPLYRPSVLRAFATFPGNTFDGARSDLLINRVRRLGFASQASYRVEPNALGGVDVVVQVTLSEAASSLVEGPLGALAGGGLADLPTLYASDRSVLEAKLENKTMVFSNTNAFYGRPDVLTAGNPLASAPSGKGTDTWLESSIQLGLYGLSSVSERVSVFAGASTIASGSWGPELFTDETRTDTGVEDAYVGLLGDNPTASGGNRRLALLAGRKAFQVDNGMILRLSSANGGDRAALQSNPRNAAERLLLAQFAYDSHQVELFELDPDELEPIDSATELRGINYEGRLPGDLRLGAMWLEVPESAASYYTTTDVLPREGLRVADLRLAWEPPASRTAWFGRAELARQSHDDFDMQAWGGYVELGHRWVATHWQPTLSYRYSSFTGDDPDTVRFERWDPLFAGGGGDEWVQGLNHYKVVQTSNIQAHRLMASLRPNARWELTPQLWVFRADELNNLGGAQALSQLVSRDYGSEVNMTARYIISPKLLFVFSTAYTRPGEAVRAPLDGDYRSWFSASALMIVRL